MVVSALLATNCHSRVLASQSYFSYRQALLKLIYNGLHSKLSRHIFRIKSKMPIYIFALCGTLTFPLTRYVVLTRTQLIPSCCISNISTKSCSDMQRHAFLQCFSGCNHGRHGLTPGGPTLAYMPETVSPCPSVCLSVCPSLYRVSPYRKNFGPMVCYFVHTYILSNVTLLLIDFGLYWALWWPKSNLLMKISCNTLLSRWWEVVN